MTAAILVLLRLIPYTLVNDEFPFSTGLVAFGCLVSHNFSLYVLAHSKFQTKFKLWMFTATFLNYSYLSTYPYCNVTLTNIVYVTACAYQCAHNLFKFSYHFELILLHLQRGNLAAALPVYVQSELQRLFTSRNLERSLAAAAIRQESERVQRLQDEEDDQRDARARFEAARAVRMRELEDSLRQDARRARASGSSAEQVEAEVQQ